MSIKRVRCDIPPFPKPRGGLNKYGKMWHSNPKYVAWQKDFRRVISDFLTPGDFGSYYVFVFYIKPKRGQQPDLENLQGAIQDSLVKMKLIPDDNFRVVSNYITLSKEVKTKSSFEFCLCNSMLEMFHAGKEIAKEIEC